MFELTRESNWSGYFWKCFELNDTNSRIKQGVGIGNLVEKETKIVCMLLKDNLN